MSAHQIPVKTMEYVRMKLVVTHVLVKTDILESIAQVSYEIRNAKTIKFMLLFPKPTQ